MSNYVCTRENHIIMVMNQCILCAIDFEDPSFQALHWSINMAQKLKVHLTILNTYRLNQPVNDGGFVKMKRKMEEEANGQFLRIERDILDGKGISFDFKSEVGFVSDRVEIHARKKQILFFVVGKKITQRNADTFNDLLDHISVPLVIVP